MAIWRRNDNDPPEYRILQTTFILLVIFISSLFANLPPPSSRDDELEDYCSAHRFERLPPGLRFTKEIVSKEYTNIGAFKAVHCCLRGYRSIEWYKDDKAYPWPGAVSHLILYPESANQTIYTQSVRVSDAGRYSCHARNDTDVLISDINLEIVGGESSGYTGKPLLTYKPISQFVPLGGASRLFCEAYLGKVHLPDARNTVTWAKVGSNITVPVRGRVSQHRVSREDEQVVGSYLEIDETNQRDYGEYECIISNGADDEMILSVHIYRSELTFTFGIDSDSWRKVLLLMVLGVLLIATAITFYIKCWLYLIVLCRDKFFRIDGSDGKEFDALVCYHEKDAVLAVGTLIPSLEIKYRYKCSTLELSHVKSNWYLEIEPHISRTRRVIVMLSQNALSNQWNEANFTTTLKFLTSIKAQVIVIIINEPKHVTSISKLTDHVRADCFNVYKNFRNKIKVLRWVINTEYDIGDGNFWCRLRLAMPPHLSIDAHDTELAAKIVQTKCSTTKIREHGSLEVLV